MTTANGFGTGRILYGGDYNPEQWPEEVWAEDMELLRQAEINTVTLNVFSWATLQPADDVYDFARLDRIVQTVADAGMSIVLATSTAALPPWMSLKHPDVNRVDAQGRRMRHGARHNACISSPTYRRYSVALAERLAERYAEVPSLVAWHVSNEYGGFCWCDLCAQAFRDWLRTRYGTVEAVNDAWNSAFWSHTYHSFEEIFPPNELGDAMAGGKAVLPGSALDYQRFYGSSVLDSFREEKAAIRRFDTARAVTTNMMGTFPDYDYFAWSDDLDVVSWDSYPAHDTTPAQIALRHDLMRAVGRQRPFMLMEQTPSRQNWQPYNSLKRPGQMRQQSWQAVARGADTVQFFQLRQSRAGCEKFHGAVIGTDGTGSTRTFREVAELGAELARVSPQVVGSRVEHGSVAVVFDWPSRWAIGYSAGPSRSLEYVREVERWYAELHRRNVPVDVVPATGPFDGYAAVVAPCLYMLPEGLAEGLRRYVADGGRLLLTPMTGLVDEHDRLHLGQAPVPLRDLAGVWVEETDALPPSRTVPLAFGDAASAGDDGAHGTVLCDVVRADDGTQVLARYAGEYYAGSPALTFRPSGSGGGVLYSASFPDEVGTRLTVDALLDGTGVVGHDLPAGVELSRRVREDGTALTFLVNTTGQSQAVRLELSGQDLLTGAAFEGAGMLEPYGVAVVMGR
ncbi:beta-galactosidase [Georgenia sp. TF02-10]|uniref:beta-galactosidase n=1 Tax=Georgenia sp. TF02-10 TaxID=2917725 RepID=UPI001FA78455|nr:beta-galactosidase [Georgenia sp. TF02-10]UNX53766.1 beta-galactosidase [Georgenia sp. TF02-10]